MAWLKRRDMLQGAALLGGLGAAGAGLALERASGPSQPALSPEQYRRLSEFLTGRSPLDPDIAGRSFAALSAQDHQFPDKALGLFRAIASRALVGMADFAPFRSAHPDLADTAIAIISSWYLGYTGTPETESTVDDARFVTYAGALMYQPTIDATVIPTFSRGHTNYWANPPSTIATD